MRNVLLDVAVVCGLVLATITIPPVARAQTPVAQLDWRPCDTSPADPATPFATPDASPPGLDCASLAVPLDYAHPDGPRITLGINRLKAKDSQARIGSLVFDPGGPGGSGGQLVAFAALGAPLFSDAVRDRFDLIGLDPRGVGASTPVRCDPDVYNRPVSLFPSDEAGFQQLLAHNKALGESCLRMTGPLLAHIDTVSAARDIEVVRQALGEGKLNYLGLSYGSMLGTQYAALYPDQIRVMALDGALDHDLSETSMLVDEATAYEQELDRFVAWCDQTAECALHGRDAGALFDRLVAQADRTPLPALACASGTAPAPCRPTVTGADLRINAQNLLLFKNPLPAVGLPGWNGLAEALVNAEAGDASLLATPMASGQEDPLYPALAIACLDFPAQSRSEGDLAAKEMLGRVIAPHLRGASQTWTIQTGCLGWPAPLINPPHAAAVRGAPPILLVNATHDPSTSYVWAHGLLDQLPSAVLLTRDGDGHTSYLFPGHTRDAIDAYLVTGVTPAPNTVTHD
jgi:pimeloyl-ACP methyl ester carboxylesterase